MKEKLELIAHCITTFKSIKVEIFNCEQLSLWKSFKKNLFVKEQLFSSKEQFKSFIKQQPEISIIHLIDILEINYFFVKTGSYICLLGPYTPTIVNISDTRKIIEHYNLSVDVSKDINRYYNSIPLVNNEDVLLCAQTIVSSIYGTTAIPKEDVIKINHNIEKQNFTEYINLSKDYISHTYDLEQLFMLNLTQGNSVEAKKIFRELTNRIISNRNSFITIDLNYYKQSYLIICTLSRITAINASIPAYEIHLVTQKSSLNAKNISTLEQLNNNIDKLIDDICLLITSYRFNNFSLLINNATNYIASHMNEPIKLIDIANELKVSPAYLSSLFKKELNITLTEYIRNEKLKQAATLLTCTTLTIQDISSQVGILDYNYFSKLFKKKYNLSPSEFRRTLHKNLNIKRNFSML